MSKYFNATTMRGRANVAKATYASFALIYFYYRFKRSAKVPVQTNAPAAVDEAIPTPMIPNEKTCDCPLLAKAKAKAEEEEKRHSTKTEDLVPSVTPGTQATTPATPATPSSASPKAGDQQAASTITDDIEKKIAAATATKTPTIIDKETPNAHTKNAQPNSKDEGQQKTRICPEDDGRDIACALAAVTSSVSTNETKKAETKPKDKNLLVENEKKV